MNRNTRWAWKAVKPTLTTHGGFVWPVSGTVKSTGPWHAGDECPVADGDGLCLAKTPAGGASGGYNPLHSVVLLVSFEQRDVLGEGRDKVRVKKCRTHGVLDARAALIRPGADLSRADLSRADLSRANLSGANLSWADLYGADLYRANLSRADLSRADLSMADLSMADLSMADLSGANLSGANLYRADLSGANLSGANLHRANLSRAIGVTE